MSKPLPTSHPMFRMIEKQLCDALRADGAQWNAADLGPQTQAVLAEILGAIPQYTTDTIKPGDTSAKLGDSNAPRCDALTGDWYCCLQKGHGGVHATTRSRHGTGPVLFVTDKHRESLEEAGHFAGPLTYMPAAYEKLAIDLKEAHAEIERLTGIIHQPETDYFLKGVSIEAEYQRELHEDADMEKTPADWMACITYLLAKAVMAIALGRIDKAKHHMVTAAAACKRWHSYAPETQNGEEGQRPV